MAWLGRLLYNFRGRDAQLLWNSPELASAPSNLTLTSSEFVHESAMPRDTAHEGSDRSPQLQWEGVPEGAVELLLVLEDPDAPIPWPAVHTVVVNIPTSVTSFAAGALTLPRGAPVAPHADGWQFARGLMSRGYFGPGPPRGHGTHRYFFELLALDVKLDPAVVKDLKLHQIRPLIAGHVVGKGLLVGTYERT